MKKLISALLSAAMALSAVSCSGSSDSSSAQSSSALFNFGDEYEETVYSPPEQVPAVHKTDDTMFGKYPSNTVVATGNNHIINKAENVTYRAYFPVEKYGELEYCFYFSNTVDSTYNTGNPVYVGAETGDYTIVSARIADGGLSPDDEITGYTDVTFGGNAGRNVVSGEQFWSDPVDFSLDEGHYLVWEWTVNGTRIPGIHMSNLTSSTSSDDGEEFVYCDQLALPQLIGAKRDTKLNITAIGDSITQGCQTDYMAYEFWSAQISQKLGDEYAFWNCGLGWSRSSDAATHGDWFNRAANADVVIIAFGTNDIISGEYGGDGGNDAVEIDGYLRSLMIDYMASGCTVIVFNAPPQDYDEEHESVRLEYNEMLQNTCNQFGAFYFDFASYLCDPETPAAAKYGGHPNGEAGGIVSDAFIEEFSVLLGK